VFIGRSFHRRGYWKTGVNKLDYIAAQFQKDFIEFLHDRLSIALAVLLPIVSLLSFAYGIRLESRNVPVAIHDRSHSEMGRQLARAVYSTRLFVPPQEVSKDVVDDLREGRSKAAILLPRDFDRDIRLKQKSRLEILVDGSELTEAQVISNGLKAVVASFQKSQFSPDINRLYAIPKVAMWFNPASTEAPFIISGAFAIVLWMFPSLIAAVGTAREKDQKTIVQIYASGISAAYYIAGKATFYTAVAAVQALLVFAIGALMGMPPPLRAWPFWVGTPLFLLSAVLFGVMLGSLASSQTVAVQATSTGGFFPTLLLSGFVYPVNNIPFPISVASYIVPARYYIELCRDCFMRQGESPSTHAAPVVLALFCVFFFLMAWWPLRRMSLRS
jgi:ABC-2 type transport system permease protein